MRKIKVPFPRYIDKIRMVGPLEVDEAAFIVGGVGFMLVMGFAFSLNVAIAIVLGLVIGIVAAATIKSIKKNFADGYLFHLLYIKGLKHPLKDNPNARVSHPRYFQNNIKILPDGYIKTLVE